MSPSRTTQPLIRARMNNCCAYLSTHRRSSFLIHKAVEFIAVLSTTPLQLQLHDQHLVARFVFFRRPVTLPAVLCVPQHPFDSIFVPPLPMNINGLLPHASNASGFLPQTPNLASRQPPTLLAYVASGVFQRTLLLVSCHCSLPPLFLAQAQT